MESFNDVIGLWPSLPELAADLKVPYERAAQWRKRNSIPARHWARLIEVAQERGFRCVTAERLAELAHAGEDAN